MKERLFTRDFIIISLVNFFGMLGGCVLLAAFPFYLLTLGGDEVTVGLAASLYAVFCVLMRPITGWLLDSRSRKRVYFFGLALAILLPPLFLLFPLLAVAILLRALFGISWAMTSTASNTNAADILPKSRFGEAMGLFGLTNSLAIVIGPALGLLIWEHSGKNGLFLASAICSLFALLLLLRFPFHKPSAEAKVKKSIAERWRTLYDKRALPASVLMFLVFLPGGAVISFIALFVAQTGVANGGLYFTIQAIGSVFVRLFAGRLGDKYGQGPSLYFSCAAFLAGLYCCVFAQSALVFYLGAFLFGVGYGVVTPCLQIMAIRIVPAEHRGAATSTYMCSWDLGAGAGSLVGGFLIALFGYQVMYCVLSVFFLITALAFRFWGSKDPSAY